MSRGARRFALLWIAGAGGAMVGLWERLELLAPLPHAIRTDIVELWDGYEAAATPEARVARALDKLETIMQHNQGRNPAGFYYAADPAGEPTTS